MRKIVKAALTAVAAVAVSFVFVTAAAANFDKDGYLSDDRPPLRFQSNNATVIGFVSVLETYCGTAPPGYQVQACVRQMKNGGTVMFMPNPCAYPDSDAYAHLACHELAHINGWPANHPR